MRETTFIRGLVRFDRIEGVNQYARLHGVWISAQAIILIQLQAQTAVRGTKLVANENTLPLEYDMSLFLFFCGLLQPALVPRFSRRSNEFLEKPRLPQNFIHRKVHT